ncbi:hypothetical protein ACFRR6_28115 [Streptomyces sp. NPDC056891]|uniref:hypothetical protein n=1 Tax=Streptomyces sp. NPDC056891 TaxID=3345961 RepID=UPI003695ACC7
MGNTAKWDEDAVLRARVLLLGSGRLGLQEQLRAYRVLAEVSPRAYLPKLVDTLLQAGYNADDPEVELALYTEGVAAGRRIGAGAPNRMERLFRALHFRERALLALGRRAEARAVCEEMADAAWGPEGRELLTHSWYGPRRLAYVLAEEGRHREAADIHRRVQATETEVSAWGVYELAAELAAAGLHEEAVDTFARTVDAGRLRAAENGMPPADLVWELVHHARLLENAGRPAEAAASRQEALDVLGQLAEHGTATSHMVTRWVTLFVLSGRSDEPAASPEAPAPPFGADGIQWSPDTRAAYRDGVTALEAEAARHSAAGALPELYVVRRRLTLRAALAGHSHGREGLLRPLFDEGVALARRLDGTATALPQALTDRALFLVATGRHQEAHTDLAEAADLLDGTARPSIVTRT